MVCLVNPYRFGGGSGPVTFGALVRKSGSQSIAFGAFDINFGTEIYDEGGWHSTSSNAERLTVPSGVSLVRVTSNVLTNNDDRLFHQKNGSTFTGMGDGDTASAGNNHINIVSSPLACSATDYFTTALDAPGASTVDADEETWFAIEKLDPATKYALVGKSAGQAIGAGAFTTLAWGAETVDTDGFHDNVTNNSRLTVPSGVTLVRLCANVKGGSVTGQHQTSILKGGSSARGLPSRDCDTTGADHVNVASAPIVVTPGDYFEVQVFFTSATTVPNAVDVWFSIEEVPSTYKRALVNKSGNQSFSAGVTATMTWDQEVYDTDSIHDNVTNNSRLTVPSGCTKARASFSIRTSSTANSMTARVQMNGADYYGGPIYDTDTAGVDCLSAMGAWVDVIPGDYFEVRFLSDSASTVGSDNDTWFCLECQ